MWWARLWYLLTLVGGAVLLAGALTLPAFRDADVAEARAQSAALEAELIGQRISAQVADQGRAAQVIAANLKLASALDALAEELPEHVRAAQIDSAMKSMSDGNPGIGIVLVGPDQKVMATTLADERLAETVAADAAAKQALTGKSATTRVSGRFVVAAPVAGADATRAAVLLTAPAPHVVAVTSHADRDGPTRLVVRGPAGVFSKLAEADRKRLIEAATPVDKPAGAVTLGGAAYHARIFKASQGLELLVAWRADPPTTLGLVGGIGSVWTRGTAPADAIPLVLGAAILLWLIGVAIGLMSVGRGVRRLVREVEEVASGSSLAPVDASALPGWLRTVAPVVNDAAEGAQRLAKPKQAEPTAKPVAKKPATKKPAAKTPAPAAKEEAQTTPVPEAAAAPKKKRRKRKKPAAAGAAEPVAAPPSDEPTKGEKEPPPKIAASPSIPVPLTPAPAPISEGTQPKARPGLLAPKAIDAAPEKGEGESALTSVQRDTGAPPAVDSDDDDDASPSIFDMSLPSLDEDDEPEPEDQTDSDIRLPGEPRAKPKPATGGSLLAALRDQSALEPEKQRIPGQKPGDSTVVRPVTMDLLAASRESETTAVGPPPERPNDALERYYREVFDELVATKAACGESVETVDFKRFRAKLRRTRKALMERFKCQDVRFRVYVKDGKAALKAAPVLKTDT